MEKERAGSETAQLTAGFQAYWLSFVVDMKTEERRFTLSTNGNLYVPVFGRVACRAFLTNSWCGFAVGVGRGCTRNGLRLVRL